VDVVLHELVGPLQQLGRDDDHTGGAVTDLLVLQLRDDEEDDYVVMVMMRMIDEDRCDSRLEYDRPALVLPAPWLQDALCPAEPGWWPL